MRSAPMPSAAGDGKWIVDGVGVGGLAEPENLLDLGNSGTSARLLLGILATHPLTAFVTGDASLRRRPMGRVTEPLCRFGAHFLTREGARLPLAVTGATRPDPDRIPAAGAVGAGQIGGVARRAQHARARRPSSSRRRRATIPSGCCAISARRCATEPAEGGGLRITVEGFPELAAAPIVVPGDVSSAAFPLVAALIVPGSEVTIEGVGLNPLRAGLLDCLREMGADIALVNEREEGGEPVADLRARAGTLDRRRHPGRARAQDDRRIPDPRRRRRLRARPHDHARARRTQGQGERPAGGDRHRARRLRRRASRSTATI